MLSLIAHAALSTYGHNKGPNREYPVASALSTRFGTASSESLLGANRDEWAEEGAARCTAVRPSERIVATLSTLPERLQDGVTLKAIRRLLYEQTMPVDEVVLNIPRSILRLSARYQLPASLLKLAAFEPRLVVQRGQDYGPATKLIPTLHRLARTGRTNSTRVLLVDDDSFYSPDLVCSYARAAARGPNLAAAALGYRGTDVYLGHGCDGPKAQAGIKHGKPGMDDLHVHLITVVGSMFVRASAFGADAWDYRRCPPAARAALYTNDDIWFSAVLARRKVRRIRLGWPYPKREPSDWHCTDCAEGGPYRLGGLTEVSNQSLYQMRSVNPKLEDMKLAVLATAEDYIGRRGCYMACNRDPSHPEAAAGTAGRQERGGRGRRHGRGGWRGRVSTRVSRRRIDPAASRMPGPLPPQ